MFQIDEVDPMSIISITRAAGFVIEGEYRPEAKAIVCRLEGWNSVRSLETGLKDIFDYYFRYPKVAPDYYQLAALRIWNAWLIYRGKAPVNFPDDIQPPEHSAPVIIEVD
jgi:hypothetical protein